MDLGNSSMTEVRIKPKRLFENGLFYPISALSEEFNPQNTTCIPPVKFFFRLELEQTKPFANSL
jgi:hypothetical protein